MQTRFTAAKMRETFYAWHGGASSPLYAAASSGLVNDLESLKSELRECMQLIYKDSDNLTGPPTQRVLKRSAYREWVYLRDLSEALDSILGLYGEAYDGRVYRALPWCTTTLRR